MSDLSKRTVVANNQVLKAAIEKYVGKRSIVLGGTGWTAAALIAALDAEDDAIAGSNAAHAALSKATDVLRDRSVTNHQLRVELQTAVAASFGTGSVAYTDFGYAVRKRRPRSAEAIAAAAAKGRATRAARHTMGRRQRQAIHGVVPQPAPASSPAITGGSTSGVTTVVTS